MSAEVPDSKSQVMHKGLVDITRKMILEGVIDPNNGTNFTIIQHDMVDPSVGLPEIAELGRHIVTVGIPNPLDVEFSAIVNGPELHQQQADQADEARREIEQVIREEGEE